ncbi:MULTISPECIES: hypothetical protein [unclassified Streptomyces]|uniref:hypothetical protein n=1 Tax=unclassified Streptomyces TaxID=2593676 RepID=UPI00331AA1BF
MKARNLARVAAAAVGTAALVVGMQGSAWAATAITIDGGHGWWSADPSDGNPGDAIKACDNTADGWGIRVMLDIHRDGTMDRVATTQGHDSPYCTGWATGNIKEDTEVRIWVQKVKGNQLHAQMATMNSKT